MDNAKKTVLHGIHLALGARMSPFGGYDMPLQYSGGIIKEHEAARAGAALFDTCHMGEIMVRGPGAVGGLENILSCDIADLAVGACRYGLMCNDSGGVVDDLIVYRMADDEFMMVVNAANEEGDFEWVAGRLPDGASAENISAATAKIDINGPKAPKIAASLLANPIDGLTYYTFAKNLYRGKEVIVSRTGYTGEIGFEVYCPAGIAADFWNDCVAGGAVPAGLGARDTLRLEMGYPLYGHELSADINAAWSGYGFAMSKKKDFTGSAAVRDPAAAAGRILRGICIDGRRSARQGDVVLSGGKEVGAVTSGSFSPTLGHAIALTYIDRESAEPDTAVTVVSGKSELAGKVCRTPFHKNATARGDLKLYL